MALPHSRRRVFVDTICPHDPDTATHAVQAIALTYLRQHDGSNHYKGLLKALLKAALENVSVQVRPWLRSQPSVPP
jgi:hypothetical protein